MFTLKIALASQVKNIQIYKNTKRTILNCNEHIFFKQQCLTRDIIPKYVNIRFRKLVVV